LTRQDKNEQALVELQRAVSEAPDNPWAQRNLGACLLKLRQAEQAVEPLRKATELNPTDERAWYGLAQALELTGDIAGADAAYIKVLDINEFGEMAELARQGRTQLAGQTFRAAPRMDAVMYCLGALERFEKMTPEEVQRIGFEIAMLGKSGLDVNNSAPSYRLRTLPGEFSGLQLVSIMYVAFQQIAPGQDVGFDLATEYEMALAMRRAGKE
jgi:tetratricopeptide (TPR) repeat protein